MQLNGISLISYDDRGNEAYFMLECTLAEALALDGQALTITAGKDVVAAFTGFSVMAVTKTDKYVQLRVMRALSDETAGAIGDLQSRVISLEGTLGTTAEAAAGAQKAADGATTNANDAKAAAQAAQKAAGAVTAQASAIQSQLDALAGA